MKTVVLDAGHGGHDSGAVGPNRTKESHAALEVCLLAGEMLKPYVNVVQTRSDDTFLTLQERPQIANEVGADAFVSYHFNSGSSPNTAMSYEGFTTRGQNASDKLATHILVQHGINCPWQKLRTDESDGDIDKEANFAVLRPTHCPSMLMEGEFIHTEAGEASILNKDHQYLRALSVAQGVLNFLGIEHTLGLELEPESPPEAVEPVPDGFDREAALKRVESIEYQCKELRKELG